MNNINNPILNSVDDTNFTYILNGQLIVVHDSKLITYVHIFENEILPFITIDTENKILICIHLYNEHISSEIIEDAFLAGYNKKQKFYIAQVL